jgi:hypothetical protein
MNEIYIAVSYSCCILQNTTYCANPFEIHPEQLSVVHKNMQNCESCLETRVPIGQWLNLTGSYVNRNLTWTKTKMVAFHEPIFQITKHVLKVNTSRLINSTIDFVRCGRFLFFVLNSNRH